MLKQCHKPPHLGWWTYINGDEWGMVYCFTHITWIEKHGRTWFYFYFYHLIYLLWLSTISRRHCCKQSYCLFLAASQTGQCYQQQLSPKLPRSLDLWTKLPTPGVRGVAPIWLFGTAVWFPPCSHTATSVAPFRRFTGELDRGPFRCLRGDHFWSILVYWLVVLVYMAGWNDFPETVGNNHHPNWQYSITQYFIWKIVPGDL